MNANEMLKTPKTHKPYNLVDALVLGSRLAATASVRSYSVDSGERVDTRFVLTSPARRAAENRSIHNAIKM